MRNVYAGFSFKLYLGRSSADEPLVGKLTERLRQDGLQVWFDEWVVQLRQHPGDDREGLEP